MLNTRSTIFSPGWVNLVFENTNQKYGAYVLRKMHRHILGTAILFTATATLTTVGLITAVNGWLNSTDNIEVFDNNGVVDLTPPPVVPIVTPPSSPPAPPSRPQNRSGAPLIVSDRTPVEPAEPGSELPPSDIGPDPSLPEGPGTTPGTGIPGPELITEAPKVFRVVEVNPSFPGGDAELVKFLRKHIRYPEDAKRKGISGTVNIEFTVFEDGTVSDLYINSGIGGGCEEEAIRVVGKMPKWKPGRQTGIAVPVRLNLPIRFSLK
jgi:protein TonB